MKFPHPINASPLPSVKLDFNCPAWRKSDSQVRIHNMAKRAALLPNKDARNAYLAELAKVHKKPEFIAFFKRLMTWYWRAQRKLQRTQGQ